MDITSAALATLLSALTSAVITLLINRNKYRGNLNEQLDMILRIGIQYPYLENKECTCKWEENKELQNEKFQRYELYCTLLFNYLERVCKHFNYNEKKIERFLGVKQWVRIHKDYWENPAESFENVDGYEIKFRELINNYLK